MCSAGDNEPAYVEVEHFGKVAETPNAVLFDFGAGTGEEWVPKSQLGDWGAGQAEIVEWLAEKLGLV